MVATDVGELAVISVRPAGTLPSAVVDEEVVVLLVVIGRNPDLNGAVLLVGILILGPPDVMGGEPLLSHRLSPTRRQGATSSPFFRRTGTCGW